MLVRRVIINTFDTEKERDSRLKEARRNGLDATRYNIIRPSSTNFDIEYGFKYTIIVNEK